MLKCDVWCSERFCILAMCSVYSAVVCMLEKLGDECETDVQRHQCMKTTARRKNYTEGRQKEQVMDKERNKR